MKSLITALHRVVEAGELIRFPALTVNLTPGDRIVMVLMENDPHPIPPGTEGTVKNINKTGENQYQVKVDWDNGSGLMILLPEDIVTKI